MARYEPLYNYLVNLPGESKDQTLNFKQLERILGGPLPPNALKERELKNATGSSDNASENSDMNRKITRGTRLALSKP